MQTRKGEKKAIGRHGGNSPETHLKKNLEKKKKFLQRSDS